MVRRFILLSAIGWATSALAQPSSPGPADAGKDPKDKPAAEKVTFEDHIKPIFREHCLSCHNAGDKSSGLALDTYASALEGGSGGKSIVEGDVDASRLLALVSHKAQPHMPPDQDPIPEAMQSLIKRWIEQGMPENSGSEVKKPKTNTVALASAGLSRPEGAPPMPEALLHQPPVHTSRASAISALAASPWSPLIAIGGQGQVVLYHSETSQFLGVLPFPEGEPQSIRFSRDGRLVLVGGGRHSHSGYGVLYELKTGQRIARVGDELDTVISADLSEDNAKIALAGPQKLVRVFETASGKLLYECKKHTDWIHSVRFSPDGVLLASADRSNGLVVWEADTGRLYLDLVGHKGDIRGLAWRSDSSGLISASLDGTVKIWDMFEGKLAKSIDAHGGGVTAIDNCNDGTMVTTGKDRKVKLWDASGTAIGEMPSLAELGMEATITVDAKQVCAGDWAGNVTLWDRADPKKSFSLPANPPTLEMRLAQAQQHIDESTQAIAPLTAQATITQEIVTQIQQQAKMLMTETSKVVSDLAAAQAQYNALRAESDARAKRIAELETLLAIEKKDHSEKLGLLAKLETNLAGLRKTQAELPAKQAELESKRGPALESAKVAMQALEAMHAQLAAAANAKAVAQEQMNRFKDFVLQFSTRDSQLKEQASQIEKHMDELKQKWDQVRNDRLLLEEQKAVFQQSYGPK
jgi:WD40 repeat protein